MLRKFKQDAAFSFLELLIVLTITLILSGILYPAIHSAREKALTTACSMNAKQLVLAVLQYEQDRRRYPPGRMVVDVTGSGNNATDMIKWTNAVSPYMSCGPSARSGMAMGAATTPSGILASSPPGDSPDLFPDAFRCPAVPTWDKAGWNASYGYNYQYLGDGAPLAFVLPGSSGVANFPVRRQQISRPDKTICVADSDGSGYLAKYESAASTPNGPNPANLGAFGFLLDPTFLPARPLGGGSVPADPVPPGAAGANLTPAAGGLFIDSTGALQFAPNSIHQAVRSVISRRHKGSASVGFLDGHVEILERESCYLRPVANPTTNALFLSNELWNGFGVDNDSNGNGMIDAALLERVLDENEAFVLAGAGALTSAVSSEYDPTIPGTGYGRLTGLRGAYEGFGPGFSASTILVGFPAGLEGPTLPHVAPFYLGSGVFAVQ